MKVAVVAGSRPEVIKLAPICWELDKSEYFDGILCLTGQHGNTALSFAKELGLEPAANLSLSRDDSSLATLTSQIINNITNFLSSHDIGLLIVQGDTASTFASALSGFYRGIPVVHVEAGLRTGNPLHPFPEENLRRMVSVLAQTHFAPTLEAQQNLIREGVALRDIHVVGNTVVDTLHHMKPASRKQNSDGLRVLVTAHRRENWDEEIELLCKTVSATISGNGDVSVDWVLHPNPVIVEKVTLAMQGVERLTLHEALDYRSFLSLLGHTNLVITDSGGVQEEATSLGIPVLVAREFTERVEGIASGAAALLERDYGARLKQIFNSLSRAREHRGLTQSSVYGDGGSSRRIVKILEDRFDH